MNAWILAPLTVASLALALGACGGDEREGGGGSSGLGPGGGGSSEGGGGSSDGGAGGSSDGGCKVRSDIDDPSCKACVAEKCEAEYAECAGPAWQEGHTEGGVCEDFYACLRGCCGDGDCNIGCDDAKTTACQGCIHARTLCTSNACGSVCN